MNTQICPWCHNEIVWDEEIGPEEECPHCFNELKGYRSLTLHLEPEHQQNGTAESSADLDGLQPGALDELDELEEELELLDLPDEDMFLYEENVRDYVDAQDEADTLECGDCREIMIYAGRQKVETQQFTSHLPQGIGVPFLSAPYAVKVHLCPVCFQMKFSLAEKDRIDIVSKFNR